MGTSTEVAVAAERKVWKPATNSGTLVITIPPTQLIKEGDAFKVQVLVDGSIIATPL